MKIINKACEDALPEILSQSVDLIYIDPPYGQEYFTNIPGDRHWNKDGITNGKFSPLMGDRIEDLDWSKISIELFRVLKNNTFLFMHCSIPFIARNALAIQSAGFLYKGCVAWNKNFAIGGDLYGSMKKDWEPIIYFAKGKPQFNSIEVKRKEVLVERKRISEINDWTFSIKKTDKSGHPTQKPLELTKQILKLTTKPSDIVLDCFAGSGTLGVAAKELGRDFILIELDEAHFKLLNQRLGGEK